MSGEEFIRVDSPYDEDARKQRIAYWNEDHQEPEGIEAWVKQARESS